MNLEQLQHKLLDAARANPPGDHVPYVFAIRILTRLKESPAFDMSELWARALWRGAASCVALTLLIGVWSFIGAGNNAANDNEEFSQHFELTMLAAVDESEEIR
jgi:hypothetical protein